MLAASSACDLAQAAATAGRDVLVVLDGYLTAVSARYKSEVKFSEH